MKTLIPIVAFMLLSCSDKTVSQEKVAAENSTVPPYDTVAVDSFSAGATSVDIARKIRESSRKFQDSLLQTRKKLEEEKLLKQDEAEKAKLQKKLDEEKKKADALKIKNEKPKVPPEVPPTGNVPTP